MFVGEAAGGVGAANGALMFRFSHLLHSRLAFGCFRMRTRACGGSSARLRLRPGGSRAQSGQNRRFDDERGARHASSSRKTPGQQFRAENQSLPKDQIRRIPSSSRRFWPVWPAVLRAALPGASSAEWRRPVGCRRLRARRGFSWRRRRASLHRACSCSQARASPAVRARGSARRGRVADGA